MRFIFIVTTMVVGLMPLASSTQESTKPKFSVKIHDEKTVVVNTEMEDTGPIDSQQRINFQAQGGGLGVTVNTLQNQLLHLSHFPSFMINGRFYQQAVGGRVTNAPLPKSPSGKNRVGSMSVWLVDDLSITQIAELHPSKAKKPGEKRLMNNVLITYTIENKSMRTIPAGVRVYMDTFVIDNDGCMFAAPVTHPNRILDGVALQDKTLPPYLQMLQRPDLANPGYVSHLTLNLGGKYEKPSKLVLTRHGAGFGNWDMPVFASMGDSGIGIFWQPKDIKPGGKREIGYVYGEGVAAHAGAEGRFQLDLGGSFEPGKLFTISATVADPGLGQTLTLELPKGMERLEGKEVQPLAPLAESQEFSTAVWKARVLAPGQHTIRVRSSSGVTQTKVITITAEK